jgi:hypothetical protein
MSRKQFCVLPYLRLDKELSIGAFTIWESTSANWVKFFGQDNTAFLEMYVEKDMKPIESTLVATCRRRISYNDWETFISVLFFLISGAHLGYGSLYSENFYFEVWEFGTDNTGGYTRLDKFIKRIFSSQAREKILPSSFVGRNNRFRLDTNSKEFIFLSNEIGKGLNSPLLRSLVFYRRTQFRDSYLFPEEADVQNYCSAFQCLLGVSDRRNVGELIADRLANQLNLPRENKDEIKKWMIDLYEARSIYTHGDRIPDGGLSYLGQRHIDIAKRVFQILVLKRCHGDGEKIYDEFLLRYFISNKVFKEVVKELSKHGSKQCLLTCQKQDLATFLKHLRNMFVNFEQKLIECENTNKIRRALTTLIYIFEDLYFNITKTDGSKFYIYPIKTLKDIVDKYTTDKSTDIEKVIKELDAHGLSLDCKDPADKTEEIVFRDIIPLSELLNAFANLKDVYLGYHKL